MNNIIDREARKEALKKNLINGSEEDICKIVNTLQPCPSLKFEPGDLPKVNTTQPIKPDLIPSNSNLPKINFPLSDDQVNMISATLKENMSDDAKSLAELPSNNGIEENREGGDLIPVEANVIIDPITGTHNVTTEDVKYSKLNITDVMEMSSKELDSRNVDITDESFSKIRDSYSISDDDAKKFISVLIEYKNGRKFNIFNALPTSMQVIISSSAPNLGYAKPPTHILNFLAKELIEQYIHEMYIDQEFIDFQKSLEAEFNLPDITTMYQEYQKDLMEKSIIEKADRIREQYPDKAEKLMKISEAYKNARTLDNFKTALIRNKKLKLRTSDLNGYVRYCKEFNFKYEKSKLMINDVSIIGVILGRKLKNTPLTDIERFVVAFCKFTSFMTPNNIEEHTFMYYTIKNIMSLDYIDDSSDFSQELLNNIIEVIQLTKNLEV
jgi:hypothetical protein